MRGTLHIIIRSRLKKPGANRHYKGGHHLLMNLMMKFMTHNLTIDQVYKDLAQGYKDLANSSDDVSDTDGHNESKTPTDVSDPDSKKDDGTKKDTTTHP